MNAHLLRAIVKMLLALGMLVSFLTYAYYSFSFAVRPDDMPRGTCAILAAIYFVGIALLTTQKED